jgi:hypothetical protein
MSYLRFKALSQCSDVVGEEQNPQTLVKTSFGNSGDSEENLFTSSALNDLSNNVLMYCTALNHPV